MKEITKQDVLNQLKWIQQNSIYPTERDNATQMLKKITKKPTAMRFQLLHPLIQKIIRVCNDRILR